ncbi:hypothetical protein ACA910_021535 [Epithemia clementina (nom. ined.)]
MSKRGWWEEQSPEGISEQITHTLNQERGSYQLRLIYKVYPFWIWSTLLLGKVCWISTYSASEGLDDPLSTFPNKDNVVVHQQVNGESLGQLAKQIPVDVVLIDGEAPGHSNDIWLGTSVRLVLWLNGKSCAGPHHNPTWRSFTFTLRHEDLGGNTKEITWVHAAEYSPTLVAQKVQRTCLGHSPNLIIGLTTMVMKGVLDPTIKGPTAPAPPTVEEDIQWNKISWKDLGWRHVLPSVFSSTGFVR